MRGPAVESKDQRRIAVWVIVLLLSAYGAYGLRPAISRLSSSRGEYLALQDEAVRGQRRARQLVAYAQRVGALKDQVLQLEGRLSGSNQLILFLQDAEVKANRAGLKLEQIAPGAPRSTADVVRQPVDVQATGSLAAVRSFLAGLEDSRYPVRVEAVQLEKDSEHPGQVAATIGAVMYSLGRVGDAK